MKPVKSVSLRKITKHLGLTGGQMTRALGWSRQAYHIQCSKPLTLHTILHLEEVCGIEIITINPLFLEDSFEKS